ncbi:hypothetical protein LINPERPRIM_LOCUS1041 [Linum perenne]
MKSAVDTELGPKTLFMFLETAPLQRASGKPSFQPTTFRLSSQVPSSTGSLGRLVHRIEGSLLASQLGSFGKLVTNLFSITSL